MTRVKKMCIILPLWGIAKSVKAQDFDSCISLVRVQLPQPKQKGPHQRSFLFWLIDGRTRKAALRKALNGLFNRRGFSAEKRVRRTAGARKAEISPLFSKFCRCISALCASFRVCRQIRTGEPVEAFTTLRLLKMKSICVII